MKVNTAPGLHDQGERQTANPTPCTAGRHAARGCAKRAVPSAAIAAAALMLGGLPIAAVAGDGAAHIGGSSSLVRKILRIASFVGADVTVGSHGATELAPGFAGKPILAPVATAHPLVSRIRFPAGSLRSAFSIAAGPGRALGEPGRFELGTGYGIAKSVRLDQPLSLSGNAYYYPWVKGGYLGPTAAMLGSLAGPIVDRSAGIFSYEVRLTYRFARTPFFFDAGLLGDRSPNFLDPTGTRHDAIFARGGLRL